MNLRRLCFFVMVIFAFTNGHAQAKLTAKAGVEFAFMEIDGLSLNYDAWGYHSAVYGPGLGRYTVLQIGGTFGVDQLNEAGFGLALGETRFFDAGNIPVKVRRKSIYINHWGEGNGSFDFGIGSQVYWYNLDIESSADDPVFYNDKIDVSSSWKSLGLDWRVMLRRSFGETDSHNISAYMGVTGELISLKQASVEGRSIEFTSDGSELAMGWRTGLTYSYTFGRDED